MSAEFQSIAWWPSVGALVVASIIDVRCRRIPNWLVIPFLASGFIAQCVVGGVAGGLQSLGGMVAAVLLFGLPCLVRAMGMGDLKLVAAAGAWIGPGQMLMAFVATGLFGGAIAVCYALWTRTLRQSLDKTSDLLADLSTGKVRQQNVSPAALAKASIPYAPAIAAGVLFSFFAR